MEFKSLRDVMNDAYFLLRVREFDYEDLVRRCKSCGVYQGTADDCKEFVHANDCLYMSTMKELEVNIQFQTKLEIENLKKGTLKDYH